VVGLLISTLAGTTAVYIFFTSLSQGYSVSGWTSLILTILVSTGLLLIINGILGIYIGQIFREVKSRPKYIVDATIRISNREEAS
jgi:dolichol-phosphate mannosyltransferase